MFFANPESFMQLEEKKNDWIYPNLTRHLTFNRLKMVECFVRFVQSIIFRGHHWGLGDGACWHRLNGMWLWWCYSCRWLEPELKGSSIVSCINIYQQVLGSITAYVDHMLKACCPYRGSCTRFDYLPQVMSVELKTLSLKMFLIKAGTDLERVRLSQLQFMFQATSIVNTRYLPLPTYPSIWWQQCCNVVNVGTKKKRQYLSPSFFLLNSPFRGQQHRSVILHWYSTVLRLTIRGSCTLPQDATSGSLWTHNWSSLLDITRGSGRGKPTYWSPITRWDHIVRWDCCNNRIMTS